MSPPQRVVLVSGASSGIGAATAVRLAHDFDAVALIARREDALREVAEQIEQSGARSLALPLNLLDPETPARAVAATVAEFGRLDGIAAIAGAVKQADLFALSDTDWDDGLAVKLHSMRRLLLAGWPHLKATSGSVVITSGASAAAPKAALAAVGSINAFIAALAKAFADRGTTDGIRVNTLLPGPTLTARRHRMLELFAEARGLDIEEAAQVFATEAHITRYGTVEEVAEGYAWLLSPHARWVHGTALRVDGGEAKTP